jgi:peptidyl-prolyl cis-trans isomerase A (cyclophilin A)
MRFPSNSCTETWSQKVTSAEDTSSSDTMVAVVKRPRSHSLYATQRYVYLVLAGLTIVYYLVAFSTIASIEDTQQSTDQESSAHQQQQARQEALAQQDNQFDKADAVNNVEQYKCPYMKLSDLDPEDVHPHQGDRHMVQPPQGGLVALVCCETTQGPWNMVVHSRWAPHGANRVLQMINSGYFDEVENTHKIPMYRCIDTFICQFGLGGKTSVESRGLHKPIPDDPAWLPHGPDHREIGGVKRFAKGYLAFAGTKADSRDVQLIVTLQANVYLGGAASWEVPWGELVGQESYETLSRIYTGYGGNGPSQSMLSQDGYLKEIEEKYPNLDYILSCVVVDETED